MLFVSRILPRRLTAIAIYIGSAVALIRMPGPRAHSRDYLKIILGRDPRIGERVRHFAQFGSYLLAKLRAGAGDPVHFAWASSADADAGAILYRSDPILLGSFHVGVSDLLGFHLHKTGRKASMIRLRVENSSDVAMLARNASGTIQLVEVAEGVDIIFTLRDILDAGGTVAMQCDWIEHTSKHEAFHFLGQRRLFPVTIYRLSELYRRPVLFCVGLPTDEPMRFKVCVHPAFNPPACPRAEFREQASAHFQSVLEWLEAMLREHPFLWFNYFPLNPPHDPVNSSRRMSRNR